MTCIYPNRYLHPYISVYQHLRLNATFLDWTHYIDTKDFHKSKSVKAVINLVSTRWGQGDDIGSNSYNRFCPEIITGNHTRAGCVAVAMAQVLHYWACRVGVTGSHSYMWMGNGILIGELSANFGNANYQWSSMALDSSDNENAQLIYHCGVACEMVYCAVSTSTPWRAKSGLRNYFGFANSMDVKWRIWHLNNWQDMLEGQLDNGWPLLYSGGRTFGGGHTWVIDGYLDVGRFHCNWGWEGDYNGFYALGDFENNNGSFNQYESAIFSAWATRTTQVGLPNLSAKNIYAGSNTLSVANVEPTSGYEWTTTQGTITGNGTSTVLNTNVTAQVCVRGLNDQCDIHSNWDCETITVLPGYITGDNVVCTSNKTFTLHNRPPGSAVTWTKSNNLTPVGCNTCNTFTVRANSSSTSGSGWVQANINGAASRMDFWVGKPIFDINGPSTIETMMMDIADINYVGNASVTNVNWSCSGAIASVTGSTVIGRFRAGSQAGMGSVYATATNVCGSKEEHLLVEVTGGWHRAYPNPVNEILTIEFDKEKMPKHLKAEKTEIHIYDKMSKLKKTKTFSGFSTTINMGGFKPDVYLLQIKTGDKIIEEKIVVTDK